MRIYQRIAKLLAFLGRLVKSYIKLLKQPPDPRLTGRCLQF